MQSSQRCCTHFHGAGTDNSSSSALWTMVSQCSALSLQVVSAYLKRTRLEECMRKIKALDRTLLSQELSTYYIWSTTHSIKVQHSPVSVKFWLTVQVNHPFLSICGLYLGPCTKTNSICLPSAMSFHPDISNSASGLPPIARRVIKFSRSSNRVH